MSFRRSIRMVAATWTAALMSCGGAEAPDADAPDSVAVLDSRFFGGPIRGHEDLLRHGVQRAEPYIVSTLGMSSPFPRVTLGDWGMSTSNPLVKGNYNTDWYPPAEMLEFYGLPSQTSQTSWEEDQRLQPLHALRNHPNDVVESPRTTCYRVQSFIIAATDRALGHFASGDRARGLFWTGHATHTLQDSFAGAHVQREAFDGRRRILDFCTYGKEFPGICHHPAVSIEDSVWRYPPCGAVDRSWACLTDLGQSAADATAGYLYAVAKLLGAGETSSRAELIAFFETPSYHPWGGPLQCANVPLSLVVEER